MPKKIVAVFRVHNSSRFVALIELERKVWSCASPPNAETKPEPKQDMEVQQRKKFPNWAEEQRKKAAELARVRAIREKKMDRNKKEVRNAWLPCFG